MFVMTIAKQIHLTKNIQKQYKIMYFKNFKHWKWSTATLTTANTPKITSILL